MRIAVPTIESQKNDQRSETPSPRLTCGPGVELPGLPAYGLIFAGSDDVAKEGLGPPSRPDS